MPTVALQLRLLALNNTIQATDDTSAGGGKGGGSDGLPPQYTSLLALFGGFFVIAILAIIVYALLFRLSRTITRFRSSFSRASTLNGPRTIRSASWASPNNHNVDDDTGHDRYPQHDNYYNNVFQLGEFRFQGPSRDARASLIAVSPAIPFKNLQSPQEDQDKDIDDDTKKNNNNNNSNKKPTPPDQTGTTVVCIICLDDFVPKSAVRVLLCGHIFHATCIDEWLLTKHHCGCPLCGRSYLPDTMPAEPRPSHVATSTARTGAANQWESPPFVNVAFR